MKLLFTGDVNFRGKDKLSIEESRDIICDISPFLAEADFRIVNLECPLGDADNFNPIKKAVPNLICSENNLPFFKGN